MKLFGKTDFKELASRLAAYHGCRIARDHVADEFGKPSLVFMFRCGNGFSFDTSRAQSDGKLPYRTLTYEQLVEKYLAGMIFVFIRNDEISREWNEFPLKIVKASSPEELSLKLAALGQ